MTGTENNQVSHLPTMCTNAATTKAMNLHAWTVRLLRLLQITICSFLVYLLHNFNIIMLPWKLSKCGLRSRGPIFQISNMYYTHSICRWKDFHSKTCFKEETFAYHQICSRFQQVTWMRWGWWDHQEKRELNLRVKVIEHLEMGVPPDSLRHKQQLGGK